MSRQSPAGEALGSLLSVRAELEREREKVEAGLADLDRVIAFLRSRHSATSEKGLQGRNAGSNEPKGEPSDVRYQEMAIDALTEAGAGGLTPQKLRDDLGLDQSRFKALVSKLVATGELCRIGGRGRGVRYAFSNLVTQNQTNGSSAHTSLARKFQPTSV